MILQNIYNLIEETEEQQKWSGEVQTKWHPQEGLFTKSGKEIARSLLAASDSPGQAAKRLAFYVNRAGSKVKPEDRSRFDEAAKIIHAAVEKSHESD